jgi:hypothetical protein
MKNQSKGDRPDKTGGDVTKAESVEVSGDKTNWDLFNNTGKNSVGE